jgi:prephenate dehydratase
MKVAFQGARGAYSEAAARILFGKTCSPVSKEHFDDVFKAVLNGEVHRAVIPIENSLAGSIHQNYDRLQHYRLKIVSETHLRIEHVLMCHKSASPKSLKEVWSHPQALSQCSNYFSRRKSLKPVAFYDTAGAAQYISEHKPENIGAIASIHAAKIYRLNVLKRNLENNHHNYTRFLGISRGERKKKIRGPIKTSISFAPKKNETGILFKMLGVFALRNVNLLKIESRPIPNRAFEYVFYLDFEGSPAEKRRARAIEHLKEMASMFQFFGSYPVGKRTYIDS